MEKETRQKLERLTQQARRLLEQEFREQLEGRYDILLEGRIAPSPGAHLSPRERVLRDKLVAAVAHKRAQGLAASAAVAAYLREAAFHTLNRFVALKMLEARKLVQECISRGEDSAGFKEFIALAPGLVALPDKGYRLYVETIFDEIAQEVRALFDRRDAATLLWPRRQALLDLLAALNDSEVASVWGEDETIGWVYQYFNGEDERRQMRAESQAPRNSRELAVRNQFFTPRYVVQFLTDNSLGRTWCEMREGDTQLAHLDYLVKPEEGFERRAPKDPRDLRVLDPACGSGHFLLYAFDLLAGDPTRSFFGIYEEAWRAEAAPKSEATGRTIREDYASELALRRAVPELILKHNLHGVDIDPRAAQIAGLALWMRAQRAYNDHKVAAQDRPLIGRTNIVTAEPMPGDRTMVAEFAATLRPQVLGELFQRMVDEMRLAGELGSLLKIDRALQSAIAQAREQFVREQRAPQRLLPGIDRPRKPQMEFDLSGVSDESFFDSAEERIVAALQDYAAGAPASMSVRRQLFADDAARGIAFIDLCRKRFDVVVMNPPFGEFIPSLFSLLATEYPDGKRDLAVAFVERGISLTCNLGMVAVLMSRKPFFVDTQRAWRAAFLNDRRFVVFADLGHRVLDGALVEVAAASIEKRAGDSRFINLLASADKQADLRRALESANTHIQTCRLEEFEALPSIQFAYSASEILLRAFRSNAPYEPNHGVVRMGLTTSDNTRFVRLWWEVDAGAGRNTWAPISKGGEYAPFFAGFELLVKWENGTGEMAAYNLSVGNEAQSRRGHSRYFAPALTYTERTASRFSPRILPRGTVFTGAGPAIIPNEPQDLLSHLAVFSSWFFNAMYELCLGEGDAVTSGAAARHYTSGLLGRMPFPDSVEPLASAKELVEKLVALTIRLKADDVTSPYADAHGIPTGESLTSVAAKWTARRVALACDAIETAGRVEQVVVAAYGLHPEEVKDPVGAIVGPHPDWLERAPIEQACERRASVAALYGLEMDELVDEATSRLGNARHLTLKSFCADRRLELVSHALGVHPRDVAEVIAADGLCAPEAISAVLDFHLEDALDRLWTDEIGAGARQLPVSQIAQDAGHLDRLLRDRIVHSRTVFVDDSGHALDFAGALERVIVSIAGRGVAQSAELHLGGQLGWRHFAAKDLFARHVQIRTMHRRSAPIAWQISTPSCSYSVWFSLHGATQDTLFRVLTDFLEPKLEHEKSRLRQLNTELGGRLSSAQIREVDRLQVFVDELQAFKVEVARVAPLWKPNLHDGVMVNCALMWRLVPHARGWQNECRSTWNQIVAGDHDWSHLAMHLWPERVVPKCIDDRSLAIAHGLEAVFWHEDDSGTWRKRPADAATVQKLIDDRTSTTVKAALNDLLAAQAPTTVGGRRAAPRATASRPAAPNHEPAAVRPAGRAPAVEAAVDDATLAAVRGAIGAIADGASKADVLAATGLTDADWNKAIGVLLDRGLVSKSGQKRGTRYHARSAGEEA